MVSISVVYDGQRELDWLGCIISVYNNAYFSMYVNMLLYCRGFG